MLLGAPGITTRSILTTRRKKLLGASIPVLPTAGCFERSLVAVVAVGPSQDLAVHASTSR